MNIAANPHETNARPDICILEEAPGSLVWAAADPVLVEALCVFEVDVCIPDELDNVVLSILELLILPVLLMVLVLIVLSSELDVDSVVVTLVDVKSEAVVEDVDPVDGISLVNKLDAGGSVELEPFAQYPYLPLFMQVSPCSQ
ncbi:unnamed protein product [Clonostachys rhizophaga]|uniref:Uncharacterized protein n=1 Tax=Clonostachys rhizophaga TaxID=160324 RepID=A0A9N9YRK6_9HYPO|nr:unnamed protein product [Clonostachys rhizophaga]